MKQPRGLFIQGWHYIYIYINCRWEIFNSHVELTEGKSMFDNQNPHDIMCLYVISYICTLPGTQLPKTPYPTNFLWKYLQQTPPHLPQDPTPKDICLQLATTADNVTLSANKKLKLHI